MTKGGEKGSASIRIERKIFPTVQDPYLARPLFSILASDQSEHIRTESERAKGARDVHLLTGDEKTVVLSRERFAADNRAARSLRTSPTLASKPFDYAYIAYVQPRAGEEKIAGEKNSNFPK